MKVALLYLLSESVKKNELDESIRTYTQRKVIGREKSIGQTEFYQANALGFKPELKFIVRAFEYKNEKKLIYNYETYRIKRTFENGSDIELTCTREVNKIKGSD